MGGTAPHTLLCMFRPRPPAPPQVTKQNLADKIAQLNAAIDDVSSQLNARDAVKDEAKA